MNNYRLPGILRGENLRGYRPDRKKGSHTTTLFLFSAISGAYRKGLFSFFQEKTTRKTTRTKTQTTRNNE